MRHPDSAGDSLLSRPPLLATLLCLLVLALTLAFYLFANAASRATIPASQIRVLNNTKLPLHHIVVNGHDYGELMPGKASGYQAIQPAYRYANIALLAGGRQLQLAPDDYVGEKPLGVGKFSYVIDRVGEDRISFTVSND
jgi:hypothetical protein